MANAMDCREYLVYVIDSKVMADTMDCKVYLIYVIDSPFMANSKVELVYASDNEYKA